MRLDKFLKLTRIIKRRTVAQEVCEAGNVSVNGKVQKPSYQVKTGDILCVKYFNREINVKINEMIPETLKKEDIEKYISVV